MKYPLLALATITALLTVEQAQAAPITITSSTIIAVARDGSSGGVTDVDTSTTFGSRSISATQGGTTNTTAINWFDTGSGALFDFDFDHTRTGTQNSYAQTYESVLRFTVGSADTTYDLSGLYSTTDVTSPSRVYRRVFLQSESNGSMLFQDTNESLSTANESFTLGVVGDGDSYNLNQGSLSGTLLANQTYRLFFNNFIYAQSFDGGASATGCLTLSIGGATGGGACGVSVPAPAPLALFGLGLLALGIRRKQLGAN